MRVVLQRVTRASVSVDGETISAIGRGLLLLVGVAPDDNDETARRLARKCAEMRVFPDDAPSPVKAAPSSAKAGRFDRSLLDVGGGALVVSQFTLLADVRKGRRPAFIAAAPPEAAAPICDAFADELRALGVTVATGRFGAKMLVELVNDGPVTVVIDSADLARSR